MTAVPAIMVTEAAVAWIGNMVQQSHKHIGKVSS
jgi:hypothetical protein